MTLKGYIKSHARRCGGIRTLALIRSADVSEVVFDDTGLVCTTLVPADGKRFARYGFREDEAECTERATLNKGTVSVVHEITFHLDRTTENNAAAAVDELLKNSHGGLIALLQAANSEVFLVGCSARFGTERPMQVVENRATTARQVKETASEVITLRSEDTDKAARFSGDFATLTQS